MLYILYLVWCCASEDLCEEGYSASEDYSALRRTTVHYGLHLIRDSALDQVAKICTPGRICVFVFTLPLPFLQGGVPPPEKAFLLFDRVRRDCICIGVASKLCQQFVGVHREDPLDKEMNGNSIGLYKANVAVAHCLLLTCGRNTYSDNYLLTPTWHDIFLENNTLSYFSFIFEEEFIFSEDFYNTAQLEDLLWPS
uniref:Uncharacterized protein n=1 Tax=Strigamia maritima TaxID=126957 RepID=T1JF17_STRMM